MDTPPYPLMPVLLVDDERPWLRSLSRALERSGGINNIQCCSDSREVMGILSRQEVALVLLDLTMPHLAGDELLELIRQDHPQLPLIVVSGLNQLETAVRCMRLGAFDYFVKTTEEDRLVAGVLRALRMQELQQENQRLQTSILQNRLEHPEAFAPLATGNARMRALFQYLEAVASSSQPVLITGESGTGKELAARALHRLSRPKGPWVAVNAAGVDDHVFADTLFGHTRGAFTGALQARPGMIEQAAGGILFLDEIGDLSLSSQVKLLRLLQEGEYFPVGSDRPKKSSARIVVATNLDLQEQQEAGRFRKDLFFRLKAHHLHLPPLRERPDDIPMLLDLFLEEAARELGKKKPTPPPELAVLLASHHFPGNVRELRAMVLDAVSTHGSGKLSMAAFKRAMGHSCDSAPAATSRATLPATKAITFAEQLPTIDEAIQQLIDEAMKRSQKNQTIAAGYLGISRPALSKRLKKSPC